MYSLVTFQAQKLKWGQANSYDWQMYLTFNHRNLLQVFSYSLNNYVVLEYYFNLFESVSMMT